MSSGTGPARSTGFTLVELLLAITLMSMLLGLAYGGLRTAARSAERGEVMLAAGGEMRAAHQFIRRQLNQLLPLPYAVDNDVAGTRVLFEGSATRIQFVAPMPGYLGSGGPQVQVLELAQDNEGRVLQFSHALLQGFEQERLSDRDPVILLEGVESADFEFLGKDENGELTNWSASWDQQGMLPVAVRLNIEYGEQARLQWPELVAGVKVDEEAVTGGTGRSSYQQVIKDLMNRESRPRS